MRIKKNNISFVSAAIVVAVTVIGGGYFTVNKVLQNDTNVARAAGKTIYVSDHNTFLNKVATAQDGDIIELQDDINESNYDRNGDQIPDTAVIGANGKKLTIKGNGHSLNFRLMPLELLGDLVFENITLTNPNEGGSTDNKITIKGSVIFDNVSFEDKGKLFYGPSVDVLGSVEFINSTEKTSLADIVIQNPNAKIKLSDRTRARSVIGQGQEIEINTKDIKKLDVSWFKKVKIGPNIYKTKPSDNWKIGNADSIHIGEKSQILLFDVSATHDSNITLSVNSTIIVDSDITFKKVSLDFVPNSNSKAFLSINNGSAVEILPNGLPKGYSKGSLHVKVDQKDLDEDFYPIIIEEDADAPNPIISGEVVNGNDYTFGVIDPAKIGADNFSGVFYGLSKRKVPNTSKIALGEALNRYETSSQEVQDDPAITELFNEAAALESDKYADQKTIDAAVKKLNDAIDAFEAAHNPVDKTALNEAVEEFDRQPEYIKNDPVVAAAKVEADRVLAENKPSTEDVLAKANALNSAIESAVNRENTNRRSAIAAVDKAVRDKTPTSFSQAQDKINSLKDPSEKSRTQSILDNVKRQYEDRKTALDNLIEKAKKPETVENKSANTKADLLSQIANAEGIKNNNNPSQADIEKAISDLQAKIDALQPDKSGLEAAINSVATQSEYVRANSEVIDKLAKANEVKNNPSSTFEQITKAKNDLEKSIANARATEATEQTEEVRRQQQAESAIAQAENSKDPADFKIAQDKIDAVRDTNKKQHLQSRLDVVKSGYQAKKDELKKLLEKAQNPSTVDGMSEQTRNNLERQIRDSHDAYHNPNETQTSIEDKIAKLKKAIDDLRADIQPLINAEDKYSTQPEYIKNNPEVATAFRKAQNTRFSNKPTPDQVRSDAKALLDVIKNAEDKEHKAQDDANAAISVADNSKAKSDIDAAQTKINLIQDPAVKAILQAQLDKIKASIVQPQNPPAKPNTPSNPSSPINPIPAPINPIEESKSPNNNQSNVGNSKLSVPNTGVQEESNNDMFIFALVVLGIISPIGFVKIVKRGE